MRNTRLVLFGAVLAAAIGLGGCGKKKPSGINDGVKPDPSAESIKRDPSIPEIDKDTIGVSEVEDGPLQDIYFDFDRYDVRPDQRPTLESNAGWLMQNRSHRVIIEGHCDERGTEEYNLALGDRRANAAREYLRTLGVPAERLQTISFGKTSPHPSALGHDEASWARNRRAHFKVVSPKVGALLPAR